MTHPYITYIKNHPYILPTLLVVFSFFLRRNGLTMNSIALDEPFSIYVAQFDITKIIAYLSTGNNPPLFEIILHYWIKIFGIKVSSVRFLPCLFSALTALYVYKISRQISNQSVAIIAYLLFTFSNYEGYYAHEARVYSLLGLLTCLSYYYFLLLLKEKEKITKMLILFTIINCLLIYAHFFGFFVLATQFICFLVFSSIRNQIGKKLLIAWGILFIAYSPYLFVFISRFIHSTSNGTWIAPVENLGALHQVIFVLLNSNPVFYISTLLLLWILFQRIVTSQIQDQILRWILYISCLFFLFYACSIIASMPYFWGFSSHTFPMISYLIFIGIAIILCIRNPIITMVQKITLLWFSLPILIMFCSSFYIPMFIERYYLFATPAFYILFALILNYLGGIFNIKIYLFALGFMLITYVSNETNHRDVKGLVEKTKEVHTSNTPIILCADYFDMNFAYYYDQQLFKNIGRSSIEKGLKQRLKKEQIYSINNISQLDTNHLIKNNKIIFLDAAATFNYPQNGILPFIKTHYFINDSLNFGDGLTLFVANRK